MKIKKFEDLNTTDINESKKVYKYTEDDLRDAFYKGREQKKLPDGNTFFVRPTFNGYLRELDKKENPYKLWDKRVEEYNKDKE